MFLSFKTLKKKKYIGDNLHIYKPLRSVHFPHPRQKIKPIKNKNNHFSGLSFSCIGVDHQNHFGQSWKKGS